MKLVIGTRGSKLALWQAEHVKARLLDDPDNGVDEVELLVIKTKGDKILDVALAKVGGKGLFVKEIEQALIEGRCDLAVHSMKDVPAALQEGLTLAAIPEREDPRDAWVLPEGSEPGGLEVLPRGATVGTSSLRRGCQLRAARPDLKITLLRGNVGTRLRKVDEGVDGMQATVLAAAGLKRMGWEHRISHAFEPDEMLPAVGQGALGIETRADDARTIGALGALMDPDTTTQIGAERAFQIRVGASCQVPIAGYATLQGDARMRFEALIGQPDGSEILRASVEGPRSDAEALGTGLAEELLGRGGQQILDALLG